MLITKQNRLLPILATIVLLMLVLILSRSCAVDESDKVLLDSVPEATAPDADTPADTIKTLTANVAAMTSELQQLRQGNASLHADNEKLLRDRDEIEQRISSQLSSEIAVIQQQQGDPAALTALSQRIDALSDALSSARAVQAGTELPVGLGLQSDYSDSSIVWIEPLDGSESIDRSDLLQGLGQTSSIQKSVTSSNGATASSPARTASSSPGPAYTVPRNATLMGATAMTALLGRVPVRGEVRDAMPFKVITGSDNLAANGLSVPGVEGMVWSGTAVGDWTLSCVTGRLESVTFVFDDGSIRTISSDDRSNPSGDADRPLGWISDARGIPCVSGERKSNAAAFLSQRIGVKAIEAAAEAAAAAQTTTVVRDSGAVSSNISGNRGDFVLGRTFADGSNEIAQWLLQRQAQSFDAVFVAAGAELAIHVDRELSIDLDPQGRRLSYETSNANSITHRLD